MCKIEDISQYRVSQSRVHCNQVKTIRFGKPSATATRHGSVLLLAATVKVRIPSVACSPTPDQSDTIFHGCRLRCPIEGFVSVNKQVRVHSWSLVEIFQSALGIARHVVPSQAGLLYLCRRLGRKSEASKLHPCEPPASPEARH